MKRYVVAKDAQGIHQVIDKQGNYEEDETYENLVQDFNLEVLGSFESKFEAFDAAEFLDKLIATKEEEI